MRLSYFKYGIDILLEENQVGVMVLEQPQVYTELLSELLKQSDGEEGLWQLSEGNKDLVINKSVVIVHTPLQLDLNSKKNLNYLYKEMQIISDEYAYEIVGEINSDIVAYLDMISKKLPYQIDYKLELEPTQLYKQYEVRLDLDGTSLLEKVINYIQLEKLLCNTKLIVFINLKAYFDKEQLEEIYKTAIYNKIFILLIETQERDCITGEKYCIIDNDKCLIVH